MRSSLFFAISILGLALPMSAQVTPQASKGGLPIAVGAGFSNYDVDWEQYRINGGTAWADLNILPRGLGIEIEARDLKDSHLYSPSTNFREFSLGGGVIYSWEHYRRFHPYGKFLVGYGSIHFNTGYGPIYDHDSSIDYAPGGGLAYRAFGKIWVRADYECQFWPQLYPLFKPIYTSQGGTIGASYDFGSRHSSY
ncbi:MAG: outer membrane beta-barrel protein [Terracidiphilus sp.]